MSQHSDTTKANSVAKSVTERQNKDSVEKNSVYEPDLNDAEVYLNTYGLNPTTIPPFALVLDNHGTNTQRQFNQKRHDRQKEKVNRNVETKQNYYDDEFHNEDSVDKKETEEFEDENDDDEEEEEYDPQKHWNRFIENLTFSQETGFRNPSKVLMHRNETSSADTTDYNSVSSTTSSISDAEAGSYIRVKPGHDLYQELMPGLSEPWRGEDRLKIMESIPYVEEIHFKTLQEKNKFNSFVNELKTNFYSDKNYYNDWDLEKMEQEKKHVLEKNDIDENQIISAYNTNIRYTPQYRPSMDRVSTRNSINGHPNYGNMEPKDLEKLYYRKHSLKNLNSGSNKNYHMAMLQKKENITEYFKQQYGRKKTQFLPSLEKTLFQNRYVPFLCRLFIVILCLIALSLAVRIYLNSRAAYYGHELSDTSSLPLKKYTVGQQPSTIMAITVNSIAVLFELYVAIDEFKGEPLGLRHPLDKLRLILLDLLFIIFSSANLALAFGSIFDDDWVCIGSVPSSKSSPKLNYICRKQRTLSSFLFVILFTWVLAFTISIVRVVNKASSTQR
ncbi:hypothetical protein QEN19_003035 [Hanseniaspora menglaensis]